MSRTRGTISRTQRSPPVNRHGGGVHRWYVSQGSEATGLFGRATVPRWRATSRSPVRTIFAKALWQFISRQALASNPSLVAAARRSVEVRSQRRFQRPVRCVSTANLTGRAGSRFLASPPPERRRSGQLDVIWLVVARRTTEWTRRLNGLRGSAGAGTVQVIRHVDAALHGLWRCRLCHKHQASARSRYRPVSVSGLFISRLTFIHRLFSCGRADVHRLALGFRCHP